jgi:hypothetical protein
MAILREALALSLRAAQSRQSRVAAVRVRRSFTVVRLDEGSVGAAMHYSGGSRAALAHAERQAAVATARDPLLLRFIGRDDVDPFVRQSLMCGVASALEAALQRSAPGRRYATGDREPDGLFHETRRAIVIGFGGYVESVCRLPAVERVHVVELGYGERRERIDEALGRLRRETGRDAIAASDAAPPDSDSFDTVCATASSLCNGTIDGLLDRYRRARTIVVQGQSGGIDPRPLFRRGVRAVVTTLKPPELVDCGEDRFTELVEGGLPWVYRTPR